ncbi:caspase family protein [Kribbella sp. NPDC051718]|uniref:caspase, EACC1-associated type n=1 Tax=Kribbella sp. NPDC051718 TaxID=3155168 RepID=UPI00343CC021
MAGSRDALVIANADYANPGLSRLMAPARDAAALAGVLGDPEVGGFDVTVLENESAQTIRFAVEDFFSDRSPEDLLLLHFSCHGLKNAAGELFLAVADTQPTRLASTAVPADFVNRQMADSRAQRIALFLDCCYGGAFPRGLVVRAAGEAQVRDAFAGQDGVGGGRGRVVVTASSAMEYAFEDGRLASGTPKPSVFTSAVVDGLKSGDADKDGDGWVGLTELVSYVTDQVHRKTPNQNPQMWTFGSQGELLIARSHRLTPSTLAPELLEAMTSPLSAARFGVVDYLRDCLTGHDQRLAFAAYEALTQMTADDSRKVSQAAQQALAETPPTLQPLLQPHPTTPNPPAPEPANPERAVPEADAPQPATPEPPAPEPAAPPEVTPAAPAAAQHELAAQRQERLKTTPQAHQKPEPPHPTATPQTTAATPTSEPASPPATATPQPTTPAPQPTTRETRPAAKPASANRPAAMPASANPPAAEPASEPASAETPSREAAPGGASARAGASGQASASGSERASASGSERASASAGVSGGEPDSVGASAGVGGLVAWWVVGVLVLGGVLLVVVNWPGVAESRRVWSDDSNTGWRTFRGWSDPEMVASVVALGVGLGVRWAGRWSLVLLGIALGCVGAIGEDGVLILAGGLAAEETAEWLVAGLIVFVMTIVLLVALKLPRPVLGPVQLPAAALIVAGGIVLVISATIKHSDGISFLTVTKLALLEPVVIVALGWLTIAATDVRTRTWLTATTITYAIIGMIAVVPALTEGDSVPVLLTGLLGDLLVIAGVATAARRPQTLPT